jgi:hypothetical protein
MPRDDRTYITVHDGMPEHPKIEGLSDAAFRLIVSLWCWCSRQKTDGHIKASSWSKRGTPKTRRELLEAGLVEDDLTGGVIVHDYDQHQRTAAEIAEIKASKRTAGALGNHNRWHEGRGVIDPDCPICVTNASRNVSHLR